MKRITEVRKGFPVSFSPGERRMYGVIVFFREDTSLVATDMNTQYWIKTNTLRVVSEIPYEKCTVGFMIMLNEHLARGIRVVVDGDKQTVVFKYTDF